MSSNAIGFTKWQSKNREEWRKDECFWCGQPILSDEIHHYIIHGARDEWADPVCKKCVTKDRIKIIVPNAILIILVIIALIMKGGLL
ncbi:MAG: hypothetical protein WC365_00490 [Candidatus Babeliales bacterium]|jgi:hypothetical protein